MVAIAKVAVINTGDSKWLKWEKTLAENKTDPRKVVLLMRGEEIHLSQSPVPVAQLTSERAAALVHELPNFDFQFGVNRPRSVERQVVSRLQNAVIRASNASQTKYDDKVGPAVGHSEATLLMIKGLTSSLSPATARDGEEFLGKTCVKFHDEPPTEGRANALVNEGLEALKVPHLDGERDKFESAIVEDGELGRAHVNLGNTLMLLGDFDAAIAALERGCALLPGDARAHNSLATMLVRVDRKTEAEAAYREAIAFDESHAGAVVALGHMLVLRGAHDEALPILERAKELGEDVDAEIALAKLSPR